MMQWVMRMLPDSLLKMRVESDLLKWPIFET